MHRKRVGKFQLDRYWVKPHAPHIGGEKRQKENLLHRYFFKDHSLEKRGYWKGALGPRENVSMLKLTCINNNHTWKQFPFHFSSQNSNAEELGDEHINK